MPIYQEALFHSALYLLIQITVPKKVFLLTRPSGSFRSVLLCPLLLGMHQVAVLPPSSWCLAFSVSNIFFPVEIKPQIPVDKCPCSYKFGRVMAFQACSQVSSLGVISDLKAWWQGFQGSSKSQAGMIRLLCAAMTQGWAHPQLAGPAEGGPAHRRGS